MERYEGLDELVVNKNTYVDVFERNLKGDVLSLRHDSLVLKCYYLSKQEIFLVKW